MDCNGDGEVKVIDENQTEMSSNDNNAVEIADGECIDASTNLFRSMTVSFWQ